MRTKSKSLDQAQSLVFAALGSSWQEKGEATSGRDSGVKVEDRGHVISGKYKRC
jgi:hypothetical protein